MADSDEEIFVGGNYGENYADSDSEDVDFGGDSQDDGDESSDSESSDGDTNDKDSDNNTNGVGNRPNAMDCNWLKKFAEPVGPKIHNEISPFPEIFTYFWDDELYDMIVLETNRYFRAFLEEKGGLQGLSPSSRAKTWKDVTRTEMKAFFALIMVMG